MKTPYLDIINKVYSQGMPWDNESDLRRFMEVIGQALEIMDHHEKQRLYTVLVIENMAEELAKKYTLSFEPAESEHPFKIVYYKGEEKIGIWYTYAENRHQARQQYEDQGPGILPILEIIHEYHV